MFNKKGQAQIIFSAVAIALAMIAAGMALGIGANVTQKLTEASQKDYAAANQTQANTANGTDYNLNYPVVAASNFKWFQQNGSANGSVVVTLLNSANYTIRNNNNGSSAVVRLISNVWNNGNATWDYDFTDDSDAGAASNNATKGMGETAKNLPILGLTAMFGVIIVFVIAAYGGMAGRS